MKDCQRILRDYYKNVLCKIQIKPWDPGDFVNLNSLFTTVSLYKKDKDSPDKPRQRVALQGSINDVFNVTVDGALPRRIVMFGEAGRGKTTAVAKMVYDWANQVEISPLKDIPILFALKMRLMDKHTTLVKAIISQLLGKKFFSDESAIEHFIFSYEKYIVILFDGYDEYDGSIVSGKDDSDVIDILRYETCRACRVLVTTRPVREDEFDADHLGVVYAKMEIHGFSHDYALRYIDKFFTYNRTKGDNLIKYLEEEYVVSDLIATPLFCTMVCYLWNENQLDGNYTRTTLFDEIMHFLARHAMAKKSKMNINTVHEEIDLKETIHNVGKVAIHKFLSKDKQNELLFKDADFADIKEHKDYSVRLGLLTYNTITCSKRDIFMEEHNDKSKSNLGQFEFFHKLAQEYVAGKYLSKTPEMLLSLLSLSISEGRLGELENVFRFAAGTNDAACSMIVEYMLNKSLAYYNLWQIATTTYYYDFGSGHSLRGCSFGSIHKFLFECIGEGNKCAQDIQRPLELFLRREPMIFYGNSTIPEFEKLPSPVKEQVSAISSVISLIMASLET